MEAIMSTKSVTKSAHKPSMTVKAKERRRGVIERLKKQLKSGMKPGPKPVRGIDVPLEDKDIKRIEKEISILEVRV